MVFDLFSTPHEGDFFALAENLSCRLFRRTLRAVDALAEAYGTAKVELDSEAVTPDRLSTRMWNPEVGHVLQGLTANVRSDWPWMAGQLALTAFLNGLTDELTLDIASRRWLDVAGRSVRDERLLFEGSRGRLSVRNGAGEILLQLTRIEREGTSPAWTENEGEEQDLVRLGSAGMAAFADGKYIDQWHPAEYVRSANSRRFKAQIEEAVSTLEDCLPAHYVWIAALLREIVALAKTGPGTRSSSSLAWPGHVRMSVEATPIQTINMLVHECCHQYFYLARCCAPLVRKDAPEVFSILKQRSRPLERVLLGFHAFGNVLLAQEALLDGRHPLDRAELGRERHSTRRVVASLDRSLKDCWDEYLEESGAELYLPLRRRLTAASLLEKSARVAVG